MATTWVDEDFTGSGAVNNSVPAIKYSGVDKWFGTLGALERSAGGANAPSDTANWATSVSDPGRTLAVGGICTLEAAAFGCFCAGIIFNTSSHRVYAEFENSTGDLISYNGSFAETGRYAAGATPGRTDRSVIRIEVEGQEARIYLAGVLRITVPTAIPADASRKLYVAGVLRSQLDYPALTTAGVVIERIMVVADTVTGPLFETAAAVECIVSVPGVFGDARALGSMVHGRVSASLLGEPRALGLAVYGRASVASVLGQPAAVALVDFTASLDPLAPTYWVADLITPGGLVRVPITSWQATLRLGEPGSAQCVITAATDYIDDILAATEFVVSRRAALLVGGVMEAQMIRAPISQVSTARGPINFTVTLLGDLPASSLPAGSTVPERALADVRTVSTYDGYTRVRAAVDWLLRPGHVALLDEEAISVETISYYVAFDAYMDLADR